MDKINNVNSAIASATLSKTSKGNQSSAGKNASVIKVSAIKEGSRTKLPTSLQISRSISKNLS